MVKSLILASVLAVSILDASGYADDFFPNTAAELITAINSDAQDGDTVWVKSGVYDCSYTSLLTHQAISIIGEGSSNTTIIGNLAMSPTDLDVPMEISNISFDVRQSHRAPDAFSNGALYCSGGEYEISNIAIQGPSLDDVSLLQFSQNNNRRTIANIENSTFRNSTADLVITQNGTVFQKSMLTLRDCQFFDPGPGGSDQYWSAHDGFPIVAYNCTGTGNRGGSAIAAGIDGQGGLTQMELYDCTIVGEVRADIICDCHITASISESTAITVANSGAIIQGNTIDAQTTFTRYGITTEGRDCLISNNDITLLATAGFTYGVGVSGSANVIVFGNEIVAGQAVQIDPDASGTVIVDHNILNKAAHYSIRNQSTTALVLSDYNLICQLFGVNAGPNDLFTLADIVTVGAGKLFDGLVASGYYSDLRKSNDQCLSISPSPTSNPHKQKIDLIIQSISPVAIPASLQFRLESRVPGSPYESVVQELQLFNYQTGNFESCDIRFVDSIDEITDIIATGDLTRFVQPVTQEVTARVTWNSKTFSAVPFNWTIDVDVAIWLVQQGSLVNRTRPKN